MKYCLNKCDGHRLPVKLLTRRDIVTYSQYSSDIFYRNITAFSQSGFSVDKPPSTCSTCPVIQLLSSESRNTVARAMSSGSP